MSHAPKVVHEAAQGSLVSGGEHWRLICAQIWSSPARQVSFSFLQNCNFSISCLISGASLRSLPQTAQLVTALICADRSRKQAQPFSQSIHLVRSSSFLRICTQSFTGCTVLDPRVGVYGRSEVALTTYDTSTILKIGAPVVAMLPLQC